MIFATARPDDARGTYDPLLEGGESVELGEDDAFQGGRCPLRDQQAVNLRVDNFAGYGYRDAAMANGQDLLIPQKWRDLFNEQRIASRSLLDETRGLDFAA